MKKELSIKLIDGEFSNDDALLVLRELIYKKINFHEANLFSSHIRGIEDSINSKNRIAALKLELAKIEEFFELLNDKENISIISNISVKQEKVIK